MREAFFKTLTELAENDTRVILLTADMGYGFIERFEKKFPDRFFNVGVAESNMLGIATALATQNKIPFCYSIASFLSLRAYEPLRNGPIFHNLPVRMVGVGCGFDYGIDGHTHYSLEDLALWNVQPTTTIIVPADSRQIRDAIHATYSFPGPIYYRLRRTIEKPLLVNIKFSFGEPSFLEQGNDGLIVSLGSATTLSLAVVDCLKQKKLTPSHLSITTFKPLNQDVLLPLLRSASAVATVEDHYSEGGLGSAIGVLLAENNIQTRFKRFGVNAIPRTQIGTPLWMQKENGLDPDFIAGEFEKLLLVSAPLMRENPRLNFIIAGYNDGKSIFELYERLTKVLALCSPDSKIIYINDGSSDDTASLLTQITKNDRRVMGVCHSRNFGSQAAFRSGMELSEGGACVLMDGDLQDPPEVIPKMIARWKEGYDIVYGVRVTRQETFFLTFFRKLFYRLLTGTSKFPIPLDAGDFSLMDGRVVSSLLECKERDILWRGLRAYIGFRHTGVDYHRPERPYGNSTNSLLANFEWAKRGVFNFGNRIGEWFFIIGVLLLFLTLFLSGIGLLKIPVNFNLFIFSYLCFIALGVLLAIDKLDRIFIEVKKRPNFIRATLIRDGQMVAWPKDKKKDSP